MIEYDKEELASVLKGTLLGFTEVFYPLLTGRPFIISQPIGRESHFITISRALTRAARLEIEAQKLLINVPPGSGKSTLLCMWTAWTLASFPDSKYLYISYSKNLAAKHTETIKRIINLRHYQYLFDIKIRHDSKAKEFFQTTAGGSVAAFGSSGGITGQDAGSPGLDRFSGAILLDDLHKPDEVHSDTIRQGVIENYKETIQQRARGINVPTIFIGQRLHEDDIAAYLIRGDDGYAWDKVVLKAIDDAGNALYPEAFPLEMLKIKQEKDPYVFASQMQQDPIPAGGGLFKPEWFAILDEEPKMLATFITADTAETSKSWNDATVFSFWGMYEIENYGKKTGQLGLHWLDCVELRIEPKDLKDAFIDFYTECMRHTTSPTLAAIEKKSTGVTLLSVLRELRGISIREIERNRSSGSKTQRFLELQPYIASKTISFTDGARHKDICITHMSKITANQTHRFDDICFVADTKITTPYGDINIQDINVGDKVITPFGIGAVTACGSTGYHSVITKIGLTGTPNHPVFTGNEFKRLDRVTDDDELSFLTMHKLLLWQYRKLLLSMELNINSWDRNAIILASLKITNKESMLRDCTWRFGNFIANKRFLMAIWFPIKTMTLSITVMKTWSAYRAQNIFKILKKTVCVGTTVKKPQGLDKKEPKQKVYNLTVEPYGVYYANNILVSNCDTVADAVRLALVDKAVYSNDTKSEQIKENMRILNNSLQNKIQAGALRNARFSKEVR